MKISLSLATACLLLLISLSTCTASLAQFAGDWSNVDSNTGGITTLNIGISGDSAQVQAWASAIQPTATGGRFRPLPLLQMSPQILPARRKH